jgi:nitrate/TMAO reductase-like tetraheme cytochrome c subunit
LRTRITKLPPIALVSLAIIAVAGAATAGVLLFRTYSYVQHDNNFCLSCHLMADPFDRFAQSAHRGLGCKACHQPTMMVRSRMALTQIIEQPAELETHAEVSNQACADCHVTGDPEKWQLIAASAGHRVHLESQDPALRGLRCVQCHSSSVHEFAATDKTCAQAGCHENVEIRLGRMGDLTIHCASCHDFNAPVAATMPAETLAVALRPQREECLSCHAMRLLVDDFPEHDPHQAACGACHDPHKQTTPAQAVESCATAGCHTSVDTLTAFHRGLAAGVLTQCTACHTAHDFAATTQCLACHQDMTRAAPPIAVARVGRPRADSLIFEHTQHRGVECTACHQTTTTHGQITITTFNECRQCHHTGEAAPTCTRCHAPAELRAPYRIVQTVDLSVAPPKTKRLPFDHSRHANEACSACHTNTIDQSAANVSCNSCHQKHHTPNANCRLCHETPRANAHNMRSHVTCAGSGCHSPAPFQGVPATRQLCLSCHQDLADHMPGRNCINCHTLPGTGGADADPEAVAAHAFSKDWKP